MRIYLKEKFKEDVNVIVVDWKDGCSLPNYIVAVENVKICGFNISLFASKNKMISKLIHCIGNSLGYIVEIK